MSFRTRLFASQQLLFSSFALRKMSAAVSSPRALLILAEGAEEMEAVITADVLRRAEIDVTIAGLDGPEPIRCSRNVVVKPDTSLDDATSTTCYEAVILPGGLKGAQNLAGSAKVKRLLEEQQKSGRFIAAICAAPTALLSHKICTGKLLTSHPSVKNQLSDSYKYSEDRVVRDGALITSRGPGTAFEFGLALVEALQGKEKRDSIVPPMLLKL